jgi:lysophospholipase L1-like esterase
MCRQILLVALFTCIATFAMAEIALRMLWTSPQDRSPYPIVDEVEALASIYQATGDSALPYTLRPGYSGAGWIQESPHYGRPLRFTVNDLGMRGRNVARLKPAGVTRVLFVGDSVTFGISVSDSETYPAVVESLLSADRSLDSVEVLNAGVAGYGAYWEKQALFRSGFSSDPDLVVVGYCVNDMLFDEFTSPDRFVIKTGCQPLARETFPHQNEYSGYVERVVRVRDAIDRQGVSGVLDSLEVADHPPARSARFVPAGVRKWFENNVKVYSFVQDWTYHGRHSLFQSEPARVTAIEELCGAKEGDTRIAWFRRQFAEIADSCRTRGIGLVVAFLPHRSQMSRDDYDCAAPALAAVLQPYGVPVIDLVGPLRDTGVEPHLLYKDGVHLLKQGHREVARALAPTIRDLLAMDR